MKKLISILLTAAILVSVCSIGLASVSVNALDYKTSFIKAIAKKGKFWEGTNGGTFCFMDLNSDNNPELVFTYYASSNAATEIYRYINGSMTKCYVGNSTSDYNTNITGVFNYYYNSASNKYHVFGYERTYSSTSSYYRDYEISLSGNRVYKTYHSPWSSLKSISISKKTISSESWQKYSESQKETALTQSYNAFGYSNSPTSVKLNRGTLGLGVGESYGLIKTILPSNAKQNVTWTSSSPSTASVDKNGKVTGKKSGIAMITSKTSNGKTAACKVTVKTAPSSIKINPESLKLGEGETIIVNENTNSGSYANAANLKWTSSDEYVAQVTKTQGTNKAVIKARHAGVTTIRITTYNGKTATCKVTVYAAPTEVKINYSAFKLGVGESLTVSETTDKGTYANAANLQWKSTNDSVLTIKKGSGNKATVTAKKVGEVIVVVNLYNGVSCFCKVKVKKAPDSIKLSKASQTLAQGITIALSESTNQGSYANAANLSWCSSDNSVVEIKKVDGTNKAKLTAKKKGNATITVKTYNGKKANCTVQVFSAKQQTISFNSNTLDGWITEVNKKEKELVFGGQFATLPSGNTYYNGNIITQKQVLEYKTVTAKVSINTPGKYTTINYKVPSKIKYTLHKHNAESGYGARWYIAAGSSSLVFCFNCNCGYHDSWTWEIPLLEKAYEDSPDTGNGIVAEVRPKKF